jgi:hypothetical protein
MHIFYIERVSGILDAFVSFQISDSTRRIIATAEDENRTPLAHILKRLGKLRALSSIRLVLRANSGKVLTEIISKPGLFSSSYIIRNEVNGIDYTLEPKRFIPRPEQVIKNAYGQIGKVVSSHPFIWGGKSVVFDNKDNVISSFRWNFNFLRWCESCTVEVFQDSEAWINLAISAALIKGMILNQHST